MTASMFATFHCSDEETPCAITGTIPRWIDGYFLRNGPGQFEVNNDSYRHWFDGLSQVHRFHVHDGAVSYKGQPLKGLTYQHNLAAGRFVNAEFGCPRSDDPCQNLFMRFFTRFKAEPDDDNDNVSLAVVSGRVVALTERRLARVVDEQSLATGALVRMGDQLPGQSATAHPHYSEDGRHLYNLITNYGMSCSYILFAQQTDELTSPAAVVATIPTARPSYIHSFGLTEHYIIVTEYPYRASALNQMLGPILFRTSFIEQFQWDGTQPARFFLVHRETGVVSTPWEAPAFFAFHHINAYEAQGTDGQVTVHVDMVAYDDPSVIQRLWLQNLRHQTQGLPLSQIRRYSLPLAPDSFDPPTGSAQPQPVWVTPQVIYPHAFEMPRTNYLRINTRPYSFVYGLGWEREAYPLDGSHQCSIFTRLRKVDVQTGDVREWSEEHCHPSEPVFVPAPNAKAEDDGVVMSTVLNPESGRSFVLVLDAATFTEVGRATVQQLLPLLLHGVFFEGQRQEAQQREIPSAKRTTDAARRAKAAQPS